MGVIMIIAAVLSVISMGISMYQMLTYKPPEPPVPSAQEVSNIPTAQQGSAIPVVAGTRTVTQPNVVWWGMPHNIKNQVAPKV